jgi:hypothetical protein
MQEVLLDGDILSEILKGRNATRLLKAPTNGGEPNSGVATTPV